MRETVSAFEGLTLLSIILIEAKADICIGSSGSTVEKHNLEDSKNKN